MNRISVIGRACVAQAMEAAVTSLSEQLRCAADQRTEAILATAEAERALVDEIRAIPTLSKPGARSFLLADCRSKS